MKVYLLAHTPEPEKLVAAAAKLCYSDSSAAKLMDGLSEEKSRGFIDMLLNELGHESPIEHVSFTFALEGVSRSLLAQITRHRHASFSVQSQRYVRLDDFHYVVPPAVAGNARAAAAFEAAMRRSAEDYRYIADILAEEYEKEESESGAEPKAAKKRAEKRAVEDARFVFPNACETKMVLTMNARALYNFFRQRCCTRAQWEIRGAADEMLRLVYPIAPSIFKNCGPGCVRGGCPEGKMSCGEAETVRERIRNLKEETSE